MKRTSETWTQLDWVDTLNATSSRGSAAGATRCGLPVGPTTAPSGRDPALASLSARQAEERGLLTSGTSGRTGTISSASADLQSSLESRLRARTASVGSTLYALTWKDRATPSGRLICALRASARRISDSGSGLLGWPTPQVADINHARGSREYADRTLARAQPPSNVALYAQLAGWPTPTVGNADGSQIAKDASVTGRRPDGSKATVSLNAVVQAAGWPTPAASDGERSGSGITEGMTGVSLTQMSKMVGWQTPKASEGMGRYGVTNGTVYPKLWGEAELAGWPTPMAGTPARNGNNEAGNNDSSRKTVELAGWPTPAMMDGNRAGKATTFEGYLQHKEKHAARGVNAQFHLNAAADCSGWPTPTTRDHKDTGDLSGSMFRRDGQLRDDTVPRVATMCGPARLTATGEMLTGSSAEMESGGQLNPAHSRWLMGYPPAWDDCGVMAMPSSRKSRQPSSGA